MMMMMMVLPVRHRPNLTQSDSISTRFKHQSYSYSLIMSVLTLVNPTFPSFLSSQHCSESQSIWLMFLPFSINLILFYVSITRQIHQYASKRHSIWLILLPISINLTLPNVNHNRILHQSDSNDEQIQSVLVISNLVNGISPALCSLIWGDDGDDGTPSETPSVTQSDSFYLLHLSTLLE